MINGNQILVYKNNVAIACCKSSELITSAGKIEISSATESMWREFLANRREWKVTANYLVYDEEGTNDMMQVGNTYTLSIRDRSGNIYLQGSAILTTCKQTYTRGSLVQGSFQFQGTGELVSV